MVDVLVQKLGLSTSCHSLSTLVDFAYEILFDHVIVQCNLYQLDNSKSFDCNSIKTNINHVPRFVMTMILNSNTH